MAKQNKQDPMDKMMSLCKRRGFIFQSSEIYGGMNSCWDYGPLGVELKRNIKNFWWQHMITSRNNVVGMDAGIMMHPKVWEASGHVANFNDPLVDCKDCKTRFREDKAPHKFKCTKCIMKFDVENGRITGKAKYTKSFESLVANEPVTYHKSTCPRCNNEEAIELEGIVCPNCGGNNLTDAKNFNLMFKTHYGPSEDSAAQIYLRPETAQGIFVNFGNVENTSRLKVPFGIGQIGKAFRNEITTGNFIFRSREFEQMEMEFFIHPDDNEKWYKFWINERFEFYKLLGIKEENLRLRPHAEDELAHYARGCMDVEYKFYFGWSELEGIADRQTFDLDQHIKASGKNLSYFDQENNVHIVPAVIETSAGVDRTLLTVLSDAYWEDEENDRVVLSLHPRVAPIKVAVFPLMSKDGMPEIAEKINNDLSKYMATFYDKAGSIGRRYRRQDEAGTPFGITVDTQTLEDGTVTLRDRDTLEQIRIPQDKIVSTLIEKVNA